MSRIISGAAMEDLDSPGVQPYVAATPFPKRKLADQLMILVQEAITFFVVLFVSLPLWFNALKHCIMGRPKKNIQGQLALVTGGGNGLGKAIAMELAKQKVNVAIADLDTVAADRVAGECRSFGVKAKAFKCNVSSFADLKQLSREIEEELGAVDILVNNAGVMPVISFQEGNPNDIQKILDVNVTSHIWATRVFLPSMIRRAKGHVVAISSMSGITPLGRAVTYTASKFAVRGFMEALREDLRLDGLAEQIQTTTVFPYFINTRQDMIAHVQKTDFFEKIPPLLPEDVARSVVEAIVTNKVHVELPKVFSVATAALRLLPIEVQDLFKGWMVKTHFPKLQE